VTDAASLGEVEAVTVDFWNTLCVPDNNRYRTQRIADVLGALQDLGADVDEAAVEQSFVRLFELFNERWAANEQFTATHAVDHLVATHLPDTTAAARQALTEAFSRAAAQSPPPLAPNVGEVLESLRAGGVQLWIICDVGMAPSPVLRGYLDHHGALGHFAGWSFSDEVGVYKPHREIFQHALEGLGGVAPERAVHVGDLLRTDVAGAKDMGMAAVRYRGTNDDGGGGVGDVGELLEADHVIDDHADLPALLGLG
jgi:FMN phosphatase YigB (HAD superfamily)